MMMMNTFRLILLSEIVVRLCLESSRLWSTS